MKFTPRELPANVNVPKTHPLAELAWLIGGLAALGVGLFLVLGLVTDLIVAKLPPAAEAWLGRQMIGQLAATENQALELRLNALLQALPADAPLRRQQFTVYLLDTNEINAVALPGGHILVFSGLLAQARSENELAMVLAHELGHYQHRDHVRQFGRGLAVSLAAMLIFGQESQVSETAVKLFMTIDSRYSRQQETAADLWGLELLTARFGHAGGATDFYRRMAQTAGSRIPYVVASHPHPDARIAELEQSIAQHAYPLGAVLPLGSDLPRK
ncbi:MAG: M48 family metallopeptidase [Desulfuromonadales bacterium]|nr:M48 family metallopeptidase [Desulfuromonadales bacterium]